MADFSNFGILMIGRLLGGIATSLLFSVFEAWLIRAHADANIKHVRDENQKVPDDSCVGV
jgi:hypothetical protein